MINRIVLVGRMVADPELRYTPSGVAVARFRIAVDRPFTSAQGEKQADFINIVAWRQSAQFAADYLRKGALVGIDGRLQIRNYTTQDGQKRTATEVVADQVRGIGGRGREEDRGGAPHPAVAPEPADEAHPLDDFPDVFEGQ
jgi:single-strand DNA-binding protein